MNLQFAVFKREAIAQNYPILSGDGKFDGKDIDVAIWKKTAKNGTEYYSVSIKDKKEKTEIKADSDLPF